MKYPFFVIILGISNCWSAVGRVKVDWGPKMGGTGRKKFFLQKRVPRTLKRGKKLFSAKKFLKWVFYGGGWGVPP